MKDILLSFSGISHWGEKEYTKNVENTPLLKAGYITTCRGELVTIYNKVTTCPGFHLEPGVRIVVVDTGRSKADFKQLKESIPLWDCLHIAGAGKRSVKFSALLEIIKKGVYDIVIVDTVLDLFKGEPERIEVVDEMRPVVVSANVGLISMNCGLSHTFKNFGIDAKCFDKYGISI